jgi:hypothetical protein
MKLVASALVMGATAFADERVRMAHTGRHQATLEIDSKPGAGSRFTVRFPLQRTLPAAFPRIPA